MRIISAWALVAATLLSFTTVDRAWAHPANCLEPTEAFEEYRLFFGRNGPGGVEVVSDEEWLLFLADTVTPRFPDGLTVTDARGQWRGSDQVITRERSKLVLILAYPDAVNMSKTDEIMAEYKRRFQQESVMRVVTRSCVSF